MLKEGLHSEVCKCRTEKYRAQLTRRYLFHIKIVTGTVQKLYIISQYIRIVKSDIIVKLTVTKFNKLCINFLHTCIGCCKLIYLLCLSVIYTFKVLSRTYRPVYRACSYTQDTLNIVQKFKRISCLSVQLIYKCEYRYLSHHTDFKELYCLCLHTLACIYYHDCRIRRHQSSVGILREILMSRCIKYVYTKSFIIKLHNRRCYRDTSLLFYLHPVTYSILGGLFSFYTSCKVYCSSVEQKLLCKCCLTRIRV